MYALTDCGLNGGLGAVTANAEGLHAAVAVWVHGVEAVFERVLARQPLLVTEHLHLLARRENL